MRNCHYTAAGDVQSVYRRVGSDRGEWRPHVAKIPHLDAAVIWAWYHFVFSCEHCTCHCPAINAFQKVKTTTSPPKLVPCKMKILNWRANDQSPKLFRYVALLPLCKKGHGQAHSPATLYLGRQQFNLHALPSYHEFTHGFPQHVQANVRQYLVKCQEYFLLHPF